MTAPKFVAELPSASGAAGPGASAAYLTALREKPGQWAEIARYPLHRRGSAASRGNQMARRNSDIEYATRLIGDEVVLYLRAVTP